MSKAGEKRGGRESRKLVIRCRRVFVAEAARLSIQCSEASVGWRMEEAHIANVRVHEPTCTDEVLRKVAPRPGTARRA